MASRGSTVNYNSHPMIGSKMKLILSMFFMDDFFWRGVMKNFHITQRNNIDINKKKKKRKIQNKIMAKNKIKKLNLMRVKILW